MSVHPDSFYSLPLETFKGDHNAVFPHPEDKVLIYSNEHHAWWRGDGRGYATQRDEAGVFTFDNALALTLDCDSSKGIQYDLLPHEQPESLPTIRPLLGDAAPRWTDETKTECGCDNCQHWSPLIKHIRSELSPERAALLDELVNYSMGVSEDLSVANAKLDGSWPGWEALKGFKPNQETA